LTAELLRALTEAADRNGDRQRLDDLVDKVDAAADVTQRLDAREAALLRIEILLTTAAGRAFLATHGTAPQRAALAAVEGCEALSLPGSPPRKGPSPPAPAPLPALAEDRALLARLRPSWLGIAFQGVSPAARARFGLGDGAALVTGVQPGSPAHSAGLVPGDIVVGQVGAPFERENQIRSFTMLSPAGKPLELEAVRRGARRVVRVTLAAYPAPARR
jgi:membrane-associated protease RseP (regulator of RpoE activity)